MIKVEEPVVRVRDVYGLVSSAVVNGVQGGITRAYKHSEEPLSVYQRGLIEECVHDYVMNELSEILEFPPHD